MAAITFQLLADWDGDYSWDHSYSDLTPYAQMITWQIGLRDLWREMSDETTLQAQLSNPGGVFNPENENSALWGKIKPQTPIKLLADGVTVWRGWVNRVDPTWRPGGASHGETATMLYASGFKGFLETKRLNIGIQENQTTDAIIKKVLRMAGLPPTVETGIILGLVGRAELGTTAILSNESDLVSADAGTYTVVTYGDQEDTAWNIIKAMVTLERGRFFFNRTGKAVFWNQGRTWTTSPTTLTIDDTGQLGKKPTRLDYKFGQDIMNLVKISYAAPMASGSNETLFNLPAPIVMETSQTLEIDNYFVDDQGNACAAKELSVTVEGVTWSSGGGTVSIKKQKGDYATMLITCTSAGTLTAYQLMGIKVSRKNRQTLEVKDQDSINAHGERPFPLTINALSDPTTAQAIANLELERRKTPMGVVRRAEFINANDGVANAHHFGWEMGNMVRVKMTEEFGHDADYIIIGEQHTLQAGFKVHETAFYLDPLPREYLMDDDGYYLLDDDGERIYA